MKEVILHIGTHKTGTSSIQHTLRNYDDGETVYSSVSVNHSKVITSLFHPDGDNFHIWKNMGLTATEIEKKKHHFSVKLNKELSNPNRNRLIISAESISTLPPAGKLALISYLADLNLKIKIFCYVREPLSLAVSVQQERIKGGIAEFTNYNTDYRHKLSPFFDLIPRSNMVVKEFRQDLLNEADVVSDFCQEIGIDVPAENYRKTNESLSEPATKLLLAFNRLPIKSLGTVQLALSKFKLIKLIENAYKKQNKLKATYFSENIICSPEDVFFLKENFDIRFKSYIPKSNTKKLENYLTDLSDVDLEPLDKLLDEHELSSRIHDSIESKLVALFYAILHGRRLKDSDAELLRDIAMKYEKAGPLDLEEAEYLMELALRARPHGPIIARKLKEYREKRSEDFHLVDRVTFFRSAKSMWRK